MLSEPRLEVGSILALRKNEFNILLHNLRERGFETIGPRVKNDTLVYDQVSTLDDLPRGFSSEQEAGQFRLIKPGHQRYFDIIPGAQSWKQFLFPSRLQIFKALKNESGWQVEQDDKKNRKLAFIGVRGCELAAIQIQDDVFMRQDFTDPIYRSVREQVFILAVNCMQPARTCFCASMQTGPRAREGFDLSLTEMEDIFLVTIGSEIGKSILTDVPVEEASAFLLNAEEKGLARSSLRMVRGLDTSDLPDMILDRLDHPHWHAVATRCLSCGNCTQVCPTCFCWDTIDHNNLSGNETVRERIWDSCFNPGFSYQAGGNTRPTIHSRYRQWLSHKLGTWKQQFGSLGCVGCGRCITWCPTGIDLTFEVAALRKDYRK